MRLIIEGPDGSGKSTLTKYLAEFLGLNIKSGEGPEKYPGEMNERARRYLDMHDADTAIFDRHCCISHPIYSKYTDVMPVSQHLVDEFYTKPSLIVYCRGQPVLNHTPKEYDSDEHLRRVDMSHGFICADYDDWALDHAHIIYDYTRTTPLRILNLVRGELHV